MKMSNTAVVPQCTHIKNNGEVCGSPAVSGTEFCYHHSAVKTALAKTTQGKAPYEGFAPIPFVFPEDRASMQINFFLLLQAFNEQRIDQKTFRLMLSTLKAMAKNLGKTGSLVELSTEAVSKETASKKAVSRKVASEEEEEDPFADLHGLPQEQFDAAVRERVDKLLDDCAAEGQKQAAANGNGKH